MMREQHADQVGAPLAQVGEFVGRDGLFYTLELAPRAYRVVMLHGSRRQRQDRAGKAFGR